MQRGNAVDMEDEATTIRLSMQQIRGGLRNDVEGIRVHARRLTDWHYYLTKFPVASVAAAAAVGFLIIPKRPRIVQADAETLARMAKNHNLVVQTVQNDSPRNGLFGLIGSTAAAALLQYGKSYASAQIQQFARSMTQGKSRTQTPVEHSNGHTSV
jgi:hypothetical protein